MPAPTFAGVALTGHTAQHHTVFTAADGALCYCFSGVAQCTFKGQGQDWRRDKLSFSRQIPDLPNGKGLKIRHWAPVVTLGSISNENVATNAGWAVDDFKLTSRISATRTIDIECSLAVRDVDGYVLRASYMVNVVGTVVPLPTLH